MVKDLNDPSNVDTVPAMLTEGEFVLNKEATQMFGPVIEEMNRMGLLQRHQENEMVKANIGKKISKLHGEGYDAPGQAYAIAKSMGYNVGGLVEFLKQKEGWRSKAYQDDAGVWTIGYGRTGGVKPGDTTTRKAEDAWLQKRAKQEWDAVTAYGKEHGYDWTPGQIAALSSFRYNGGQGMLNQLTQGGQRDNATIAQMLPQYNKITDPNTGQKVPLDGLTNRRNAELELWGGQGNQVPGKQEAPPPTEPPPKVAQQQAPAQEYLPADQPEAGGGLSVSDFAGLLGPKGGAFYAPSIGEVGQNPEYIQSVAAQKPKAAFKKDQFGINRLDNIYGSYNMGGPIQYLRAGGKVGQVKVWDGRQYIWVDRNDPRAQRDAQLAKQVQKQQAPLNFRKAAQVRAQQQIPQMPRPEGDYTVSPLGPRRIPKPNSFQNQAGALAGKIMTSFPPEQGVPPQFDQTPPVPGTDEAILQNSSQQVEQKEEEQAEQGWWAQQFAPLKGSLRRNWEARHPDRPSTAVPPGTGSPPPPGIFPDTGPAGQGAPTSLEGLSEEEIATLYDAGDPAAIEYAQQEEDAFRTNEALRQAQLQGAVTAPDAPGAQFQQARIDALSENLTELGVPPESQGVGADINVGGPDAPLELGTVPGLDTSPPAVEAVPGVDTKPPEQPDAREEAIKEQSLARKDPGAAMTTMQEKVDQIQEQPPAELNEKPVGEVAAAAQQAARKDPRAMGKAQSAIKDAFGDLFDSKELVRMGVLFLGAMATGATPGQALAFAGQQYLARVDAAATTKQKYQQELVKSGKYTPASVQAYIETEDASVLIPTEAVGGLKELGNRKEFYTANGSKISAREVQTDDDSKYWVDENNRPISLNRVHEDASRAPGTPEYRKRVLDESKQYGKIFEEMQDRFGKFGEGKDVSYATELLPSKVGNTAAKWAITNNVPPDGMGQLIDNAYQSALNEAKMTGKKPRSIEAYLNEQFIISQVGDTSLFQNKKGEPASALKVNELMGDFYYQLKDLPQYQGKSKIAITTTVVQEGRNEWNKLAGDIKQSYARRAGPGQSAFMVWLRDQIAKPQ